MRGSALYEIVDPVGFALRRALDRLGLSEAPNTTVILCGDASCNTFTFRLMSSLGAGSARFNALAQTGRTPRRIRTLRPSQPLCSPQFQFFPQHLKYTVPVSLTLTRITVSLLYRHPKILHGIFAQVCASLALMTSLTVRSCAWVVGLTGSTGSCRLMEVLIDSLYEG